MNGDEVADGLRSPPAAASHSRIAPVAKELAGKALVSSKRAGLVGMIEAADAMVPAANVVFVGYQKVDAGLVTAIVRGDVASVKAATDAGAAAARRGRELVGVHVIAESAEGLDTIFPSANRLLKTQPEGRRQKAEGKSFSLLPCPFCLDEFPLHVAPSAVAIVVAASAPAKSFSVRPPSL